MIRTFIHEDFLLESRQAVELYHRFAEDAPIVDYHCHLSPREIAQNRRWENLAQIWLEGDHYKWRALRANGVEERLITGPASDREKFQAWAETVPKTLGNPLYHWTHLELNRPFGISDRLLDGGTAQSIWEQAEAALARPDFSCRGLLQKAQVVCLCTTDDPVDSLEYHQALAQDATFRIQVLPSFRPDRAMAVEAPAAFRGYVEALSQAAGCNTGTYAGFLEALKRRHDFFHAQGCRLSDHGLDQPYGEDCTEAQASAIFRKVLDGAAPSAEEATLFKSAMLHFFGVLDHGRGWVQQYHLGPLRNVNPRMFRALGPDAGFDAIGDAPVALGLAKLLGRLDAQDRLARTIVYNLNPRDNELIAALIGCFQEGPVAGKLQFGSAWWFLDQREGIERHLKTLGAFGLLSRFVGMLTDSRSFLSYSRHEYFRRILCHHLGTQMAKGWIPDDLELVGTLVADICSHNAQAYFSFPEKP